MKVEFDLQGEGGNIIWVMYKVKNILEYIGAGEAIKPYVDQVMSAANYGEAVNLTMEMLDRFGIEHNIASQYVDIMSLKRS